MTEIEFFQLAARAKAVHLEILGMKRRGRSAYAIAKQVYNLRGTREHVRDQLQNMVSNEIEMRRAAQERNNVCQQTK